MTTIGCLLVLDGIQERDHSFGLVDVSFMVFLTSVMGLHCFSVQTDGDLPGGIQLDQTMFIGGIN